MSDKQPDRSPIGTPTSETRRIPRGAITSAIRTIAVLVATFVIVATLALTVGPRFLPYQTFIVLSSSMEPAIPVGAAMWAFEQWQRRVWRRSHTMDGIRIVTPS
ncbi:MAG: S26 family signal peptidase [Proteobacteria bacterium]|nr:S26 family signal peptidase [Pseudomonadota bacterium]